MEWDSDWLGNQQTIAGAHAARAGMIEILDVNQLKFSDNDFDSQVEELLNYIRLSREQVLGLSQLYEDLRLTLSQIWPGCKVHAFGSVVTGLAIKTSDADCYIEIPEEIKGQPKSCVMLARRLFDQYPETFQKTFVILHAKVPIVQFYYSPTSINCDVSFSQMTGPMNSNFIGLLLSLDKRALQLAIILKYWSKVHYLTGTNLIPNYVFILMIIFYLQYEKILPPLKPYINDSFVIGDWHYGSDQQALREYKIENNITLLKLLVGFFCYYKDFNHEKYVICPYLGYPVERNSFCGKKKPIAPEGFPLYAEIRKKNTGPLKITGLMCVQDIFEHNRNCATSVWPKQFAKFTEFIKNTADIFPKYVNRQNFSPYLLDIMTNVPPQYANIVKVMPRKRFFKDNTRKVEKNKAKKAQWKAKLAEKAEQKKQEKLAKTMKRKKHFKLNKTIVKQET